MGKGKGKRALVLTAAFFLPRILSWLSIPFMGFMPDWHCKQLELRFALQRKMDLNYFCFKKNAFLSPNTISDQTILTSETVRVGGLKRILPKSGFLDYFWENIFKEHSNGFLLEETWAGLKASKFN